MDLEKRVIELETRLAYQDHLVGELNEVVIRQQDQIDALAAEVNRLKQHLREQHGSGLARPDEEVPPPHY